MFINRKLLAKLARYADTPEAIVITDFEGRKNPDTQTHLRRHPYTKQDIH